MITVEEIQFVLFWYNAILIIVMEVYFHFMIWYDDDRFRICYLYEYIIHGGSSST